MPLQKDSYVAGQEQEGSFCVFHHQLNENNPREIPAAATCSAGPLCSGPAGDDNAVILTPRDDETTARWEVQH